MRQGKLQKMQLRPIYTKRNSLFSFLNPGVECDYGMRFGG